MMNKYIEIRMRMCNLFRTNKFMKTSNFRFYFLYFSLIFICQCRVKEWGFVDRCRNVFNKLWRSESIHALIAYDTNNAQFKPRNNVVCMFRATTEIGGSNNTSTKLYAWRDTRSTSIVHHSACTHSYNHNRLCKLSISKQFFVSPNFCVHRVCAREFRKRKRFLAIAFHWLNVYITLDWPAKCQRSPWWTMTLQRARLSFNVRSSLTYDFA